MAAPRITESVEGEWLEVRPQIHHGTRRVAGHLKIIERSRDCVVVYTRYDPGLVIEKHSHLANEVLFIVEGELFVGDRCCPSGTTIVLEKGTPFGPLTAGSQGTVLFETFDGETGHVSEDYEGFLRILEERHIEILAETDATVPAQGAGRKTSD
jgi:mannose-6-phosphate isomerase-like protein (cupin superfamily)